MTAPRDPQLDAAFSDLANALQVAAPLSARVRRTLGDVAPDLLEVEASLDRAVRAVRQLRENAAE